MVAREKRFRAATISGWKSCRRVMEKVTTAKVGATSADSSEVVIAVVFIFVVIDQFAAAAKGYER